MHLLSSGVTDVYVGCFDLDFGIIEHRNFFERFTREV